MYYNNHVIVIQIDKQVLTYTAEEKPEQKRPVTKYWCFEENIDYVEIYPLGIQNYRSPYLQFV